MVAKQIDFWFSLGSTYTYLSAMRCAELCENSGVAVHWRPFQLRSILEELNGMPFKEGSPKTRYMWHDIGRQSKKLGLKPILPAHYPNAEAHLANRVARIGFDEGWGYQFVQNFYRRWFETENCTMKESDIASCIAGADQTPTDILERAKLSETLAKLERETDEARKLGIFGSPTFSVGNEIFWGDDRLEDAVKYCLAHSSE